MSTRRDEARPHLDRRPLGLGRCPLSGPFWGEGDILLGGAGSDSITGRAGDDIIDGDQELRVRISVRTNPANPATEIGTTDLMEGQYLRDAAGNPTGPTLQQAVFAGQVDPGNLVIVREIKNNAGPADIDTSNYEGPRSQYTITANANGSVTVCDSVSVAAIAAGGLFHEAVKGDGCDILWRIERLQFADQLVTVAAATAPAVTTTPALAAGLAFGNAGPEHDLCLADRDRAQHRQRPADRSAACRSPDRLRDQREHLPRRPGRGWWHLHDQRHVHPDGSRSASASLLIADNAAGSPQSVAADRHRHRRRLQRSSSGTRPSRRTADSNAAGLAEAFKTTCALDRPGNAAPRLRRHRLRRSRGRGAVLEQRDEPSADPPHHRHARCAGRGPVQHGERPGDVNVTAGTTYWIAVLGPTGTFRFRDRANVGAGSSETSSVSTLIGDARHVDDRCHVHRRRHLGLRGRSVTVTSSASAAAGPLGPRRQRGERGTGRLEPGRSRRGVQDDRYYDRSPCSPSASSFDGLRGCQRGGWSVLQHRGQPAGHAAHGRNHHHPGGERAEQRGRPRRRLSQRARRTGSPCCRRSAPGPFGSSTGRSRPPRSEHPSGARPRT